MKKEKKTMYSVRLMMIIIGLLIPMNLVTLLMSVFAVQSLFTQMKENTEGTLRVYMSQIDAELTSASTRSLFISQDSVDSVYLASRPKDWEKDSEKSLRSVVKLYNEYNDYLNENRWVGGMYSIYPAIDEIVFADNLYSYSRHKEEIHTYLDERIASKRAVNKWECVQFGNEASVFYMYPYKNGYYGIWYDLNNLLGVLKIPEKDDYLAVTDGDGTVLFATEAMREVLGESEGGLDDLPSGYESVSIASESSPMVLVRLLSTGNVFHALPTVLRIMLLFSLLGIFALPVILYYMRKWIIQPVRKLDVAMEEISRGNMDYRIAEGKQGSEFDRINRTFNRMMEDVSRLKIDVYEEQLEKQHIRLKFLSQQIQPHFILNTLNILYSYEKDEYPLIQKMILCLSRYFRYIVNANEDVVPLRAEMDHIKNYFEIQQARYPDTFFAFVEYEEEIGNCLVPPLLIQNFAENSIKHSIKIGNHIDIVVIAQRYGEDKIRVRMLDTGQGIDQELVDKIGEFQRTGVRQEGLGVGIQNAIERLKVLYGAETEFRIYRDKPHGTRIEIVLPLRQGDDPEDE